MRFSFAILLLLLPTIGLAQKACYSPSDCVAPQHCSSLDNKVIPGTCVTNAPVVEQKVVKPVAAPIVKKPAPVVSPPKSSSAKSSAISSSSSSVSSSSSSVPALTEDQQSKLNAMFKSMMESMASLAKSITSSFASLGNSLKCLMGCSE